jgi:phosphate transport system protein
VLLDQLGVRDVETTVDVALIGRYYERIADYAVGLARRVAFLAETLPLDVSGVET